MCTETQKDDFINAYIECALWSSTDENDEPLDGIYFANDLTPESKKRIVRTCLDFLTSNDSLINSAINEFPFYSYSQAGHDFWLTRNHHGAGFWDRGINQYGEKLTKSSHAYGESYFYVTDDNYIECMD